MWRQKGREGMDLPFPGSYPQCPRESGQSQELGTLSRLPYGMQGPKHSNQALGTNGADLMNTFFLLSVFQGLIPLVLCHFKVTYLPLCFLQFLIRFKMGGKERLHVGLGTASRWYKLRRNCPLWFPTMHQNSTRLSGLCLHFRICPEE